MWHTQEKAFTFIHGYSFLFLKCNHHHTAFLHQITKTQSLSINHSQFLVVHPFILHQGNNRFVSTSLYSFKSAWCPRPPRGIECLIYRRWRHWAHMGQRWWGRDTTQIIQSSPPLQGFWVFLCWTVCWWKVPTHRCEGPETSDWLLRSCLHMRKHFDYSDTICSWEELDLTVPSTRTNTCTHTCVHVLSMVFWSYWGSMLRIRRGDGDIGFD